MTDIRRRLRAALFLSMFASLPAWADDVSARWLTQVTAVSASSDTAARGAAIGQRRENAVERVVVKVNHKVKY